MPATPPSSLPDFATSPAPGDLTTPPSGLRSSGWEARDIPPNSFVNWFWNLVYQWLLFFYRSNQVYTDLAEAIDDSTLAYGDTFILNETNYQRYPSQRFIAQDSGFLMKYVVATGKSVVYANGGSYIVMDTRDIPDMGSASFTSGQQNYTTTNPITTIYQIESDGLIVVVSHDNYVECFDHDTGVSQWVYNHGAATGDLALDANRVYFGGAAGTGGYQVRALNRATGAVVWSYNHGATINSICTDGRRLFMRGSASSFPSGAHLRSIEASNGKDYNDEGTNNGASDMPDVWQVTETTACPVTSLMETDGKHIYMGHTSAATYQLYRMSCADGAFQGYGLFDTSLYAAANDIEVDQTYVYMAVMDAGQNNGAIYCYDKKTLSIVWVYTDKLASVTRPIWGVASDGARLFLAGDTDTPDRSVQVLQRDNRPGGLWVKVNPDAANYLPYHRLAIPTED